jgi:hypothetical protein
MNGLGQILEEPGPSTITTAFQCSKPMAPNLCVPRWGFLSGFRKFHGKDGPTAFVTLDRDSQAVQFVQKDLTNCPRLPVRQHHRLTNEVNPRLFEVAKDVKGYFLPCQRGSFSNGLTPSQDGSPKASRR